MKPNFALDLSHDGIGLFHRSKSGWTLVGDVALDDPELPQKVDLLRKTASDLEQGGVTTKLIVPNSQVLFTSLTAPGPDDIAREVQIRAGLEGLTPYAVGDLVFDWRAEGDQVHVAVLARETLDEAEAFAAEHRLNPVSFAARADGKGFSGEAFFGKSKSAAAILGPGERVEPDSKPVPRQTKAAILQDPVAVPEPDPVPEPEPASNPTPPTDDSIDALLDSVPDPAADPEPAEPTPAPEAPKAKPAPDPSPVLAPFPPTPDDTDEPAPLQPITPVIRDLPEDDTPPAPKPRKKKVKKPAKAKSEPVAPGASSDTAELAATAPQDRTPDDPPVDTAPPAFATRRGTVPGPEDASDADAPSSLDKIAPRVSMAPPVQHPAADAKIHGPDTAKPGAPKLGVASRDVPQPHVPVTAPSLLADDSVVAKEPEPNTSDVAKKAAASGAALLSATRKGLSGAAKAGKAAASKASDKAAERRDAKRAAVAAAPVPETSKPPKSARPFVPALGKRTADATATDTSVAPPPKPSEADSLTVFGARNNQNVGGKPPYLGLMLTLLLLLAMAIAAVWSMFFLSDDNASLFGGNEPDFTVATPTTETRPLNEDPTDAIIAEEFAPALDESPAAPDPIPETPDPLTRAAAEARYAATGIWQRAPDPPVEAQGGRIDDLYVASIDPRTDSHDAIALPPERLAGADPRPPAQAPPPPRGSTFDLDERGLVRATPEGTLTPDGVFVFAGRPPVVTGRRPGTAPAVEVPDQPDIPRIRPNRRPEGLVEGNERATLGGYTRAQLAAIRPSRRPERALPPQPDPDAVAEALAEAAEQAEEDIAAAPTEQAIATSPKPDHRPRNFARIVERARENANASDGSSVSAAAATTTPKIPTRASVAQQATVKNAINLRKVNLIGIYGASNSRRALVRLSNGRYVKVRVGDRLDGGKVTAISSNKLVYQKGSRSLTLEVLPLG
ncbi:hypothetical protein [Aliiroseovarius subalbicans]|uniref:hypothetical protein n=1 Tax=Aliiroseovarius subalbicans TaxID=2925840 RepID=UPI001F59AD77|nr:hypothetical protein [Aliiroseovarius subalbicans]MCI2398090.1 hypothetical protein [Aliiroseovarius subalbicans]